MKTIRTGIGRMVHALGTPARWTRRRDRRRTAGHMLYQAKVVSGPHSVLTPWDGSERGGVGVLKMERGSVQLYVTDEGYHLQWHGAGEHPIDFDEVRTADDATLEAVLRKWSARWYLDQRRPTAGPHHMEI